MAQVIFLAGTQDDDVINEYETESPIYVTMLDP